MKSQAEDCSRTKEQQKGASDEKTKKAEQDKSGITIQRIELTNKPTINFFTATSN